MFLSDFLRGTGVDNCWTSFLLCFLKSFLVIMVAIHVYADISIIGLLNLLWPRGHNKSFRLRQ